MSDDKIQQGYALEELIEKTKMGKTTLKSVFPEHFIKREYARNVTRSDLEAFIRGDFSGNKRLHIPENIPVEKKEQFYETAVTAFLTEQWLDTKTLIERTGIKKQNIDRLNKMTYLVIKKSSLGNSLIRCLERSVEERKAIATEKGWEKYNELRCLSEISKKTFFGYDSRYTPFLMTFLLKQFGIDVTTRNAPVNKNRYVTSEDYDKMPTCRYHVVRTNPPARSLPLIFKGAFNFNNGNYTFQVIGMINRIYLLQQESGEKPTSPECRLIEFDIRLRGMRQIGYVIPEPLARRIVEKKEAITNSIFKQRNFDQKAYRQLILNK